MDDESGKTVHVEGRGDLWGISLFTERLDFAVKLKL
jgi:hypothetical protein